ncbi:MAG: DNA polymerase/3'-5' exonuclease PolX [bacterium]
MKNKELSIIFEEIGDMLGFLGENPFRVRTYKRAAQIINGLNDDIEILHKEGKLKEIKGFGESLLSKIDEYINTGSIQLHSELKEKIPSGILELLNVPYLGPATLRTLYQKLHITNMDELIKACEDKLIRNLPNFGPKKEENIIKGLLRFKESHSRFTLGSIYEDVITILKRLSSIKDVQRVDAAGSFRRMKETVGDIDILASSSNHKEIINHFCKMEEVKEVLSEGETKAAVILQNGIQVDLRVVNDDSFGACLQYFTGSKQHNVKLRGLAKSLGLKINEYGVFDGDKMIAGKEEEDIYSALSLLWIPPELREDTGEIELAKEGQLPQIIEYTDVKGDIHLHSTYSDGGETIEKMAEACIKLGYEYMVVTDHSQSLRIAKGLDIERLKRQWDEIDSLNKKYSNFKIFKGSEVDIKKDGSLDYPDEVLKELDFVIASVHSGFKEDEASMTRRVIKAMENPYVTVIGHPTGRIINLRDPYNLNLKEILVAARETKTFLEMNAYFERLDLNDVNARMAKEYGVKLCLGTDAHNTFQLKYMRFGVAQARRGWLSREDIINTLPLKDFEKSIKLKR